MNQDTNLQFAPDTGVDACVRTGTDASQAVTINSRFGRITSSTANLAAITVERITVTCPLVKANSIIVGNVRGGGNAVGGLTASFIPGNGSFTIDVRNNFAATAASAVYIVEFMVINPIV